MYMIMIWFVYLSERLNNKRTYTGWIYVGIQFYPHSKSLKMEDVDDSS
jgi:hypothetical protein